MHPSEVKWKQMKNVQNQKVVIVQQKREGVVKKEDQVKKVEKHHLEAKVDRIHEKKVEEQSYARQKMARGELTPTAAKRPVLQQGSMSPGAQEGAWPGC